MCFHARIVSKAQEIESHYGVTRSLKAKEADNEFIYHHANGYNHDSMWIIPQERSDHITPMIWGLLPYNKSGADHEAYYKKSARFGAGLNVQSEKLFGFYLYKPSALTRRCIVPVSGFYEPHNTFKKVKGKYFKVPFYFHAKDDKPFVNLAGIYSITPDNYVSFSILTKEAEQDSMYAKIHNNKNRDSQFRQVIPLADEQIGEWLSNDLGENEVYEILQNDLPEDLLSAHPISKDLNSPIINSNRPDIIEHIKYSEIEINY